MSDGPFACTTCTSINAKTSTNKTGRNLRMDFASALCMVYTSGRQPVPLERVMDFDVMIAPHPACVASLRQAARKRGEGQRSSGDSPLLPACVGKGAGG